MPRILVLPAMRNCLGARPRYVGSPSLSCVAGSELSYLAFGGARGNLCISKVTRIEIVENKLFTSLGQWVANAQWVANISNKPF
jgi:hypothetical protein